MRSNRLSVRTLLSLALVLLFALTAAIPTLSVYAEPAPYTVTINPQPTTDTTMADRFTAYAIFTGDLLTEGDNSYTAWDGTPQSNVLVNIEWGKGVNVDGLMKALLEDEAFKTAITDFYPSIESEKDYNTTGVARAVANMLEAHNELVETFARLADKNKKTDAAKTSTWSEEEEVWNIGLDNAGYYLIVDGLKEKGTQEAPIEGNVSAFILGVFGNSNVNMKSTTPTPDKQITNPGENGNGEGADYEIGDIVEFTLTGTLPENYGQFETYYYSFVDTLSNGLTYTNDSTNQLKVYVENDGKRTLIPQASNYTITPPTEGSNLLKVTFTDLKKVKGEEGADVTIDRDSIIVVVYYAKLNENAVLGNLGNENTVHLEFSNDPDGTGYGKSTEEKVRVYTFGLDLTKIGNDPGAEERKPLEGAGFKLSKVVTGEGAPATTTTLYATLTDNKDGTYTISGWVDTIEAATEAKTNAEGKLIIKGIESAVNYTLTETTTPNGYNTMLPVPFTLNATINETGDLEKLTVTVNGREEDVEIADNADGTAYLTTGTPALTLVNYLAPTLPGTGGIGTTIFFVAGGLLLAAAVAYFIVSGTRKARTEKK